MYFTFNESSKLYELRNSMNSTVKRIEHLAIIYDSKEYKLIEYGEAEDMEARLLSYSKRKMYNMELIKSKNWYLDVINDVINDKMSIINLDQRLIKFAGNHRHVYFRNPKGFDD